MFSLLAGIFGGPAGVVTGWFASLAGKVIGILALLAIIGGLLASVYFSYTDSIRAAEDAKLQVKQQAQIIANKNAQIKNLQDLADIQSKVVTDQTVDNKAIDLQSDSVRAFLAQRDSSKDTGSSQVLKDTFDKLYGKNR